MSKIHSVHPDGLPQASVLVSDRTFQMFAYAKGRKAFRPLQVSRKTKKSNNMTSKEYYNGNFEEGENITRDWEKDCFLDNYGLYDEDED